ncbi:hypothetical protein VTK56DRAFT_157 [Thermocarpiscus australiensis]
MVNKEDDEDDDDDDATQRAAKAEEAAFIILASCQVGRRIRERQRERDRGLEVVDVELVEDGEGLYMGGRIRSSSAVRSFDGGAEERGKTRVVRKGKGVLALLPSRWGMLHDKGSAEGSKAGRKRRALAGMFTRRLGTDKSRGTDVGSSLGSGESGGSGGRSSDTRAALASPLNVSVESARADYDTAGNDAPQTDKVAEHGQALEEKESEPEGQDASMVLDAPSWFDDILGSDTANKGKAVDRSDVGIPGGVSRSRGAQYSSTTTSTLGSPPESLNLLSRQVRRHHDHGHPHSHPFRSDETEPNGAHLSASATKFRVWNTASLQSRWTRRDGLSNNSNHYNSVSSIGPHILGSWGYRWCRRSSEASGLHPQQTGNQPAWSLKKLVHRLSGSKRSSVSETEIGQGGKATPSKGDGGGGAGVLPILDGCQEKGHRWWRWLESSRVEEV